MRRAVELLSDRESGASELERGLCRLLLEGEAEATALETSLGAIGDLVIERYPAMANLLRWVNDVWLLLERTSPGLKRDRRVRTWLSGRLRDIEHGGRAIGKQLAPLLGERPTAFTLSRSGTLLEALRTARRLGASPTVLIAESRPACEGLAMAEELAAAAIETRVLPDLALASLLCGFRPHGLDFETRPEESVLLLGADSIGAAWFVNKVGSAALAGAAGERRIPVLVAAGEEKLLPAPLYRLQHISVEHWAEPGSERGLRFDFERVPNRLVSSFVFPAGRASPSEVARKITGLELSRFLADRLDPSEYPPPAAAREDS